MTRGNVLRGMGLSRQPWGKRIASLVLIAAMMLLAQANLIDVYGGVATWAIAAVPATLLGAIIALAGMLPALRLWWQIVFLAFAQFIIGPVVTLSSTTSHYVIPTLKTLSSGWEMTFGSFKYIISVDPPLGTQDGVLMAVWTIGLWLTFFTGVFAINANAWLSLVGVLPLAAAVAVCALLGTDSGWQRAICGIAFALLLIIWLSWRLELLEWGRWISALIIVVLAAGLAFGGTLLVPQDRFVLRDRYDPPLSPYDYTSPLSGMRSYIKAVSYTHLAGPASITFTAVDGKQGSDKTKIINSAVITLQITVIGRDVPPPTFSSSTIDVEAGADPKTVDLTALTHAPSGVYDDEKQYTYSGGSSSSRQITANLSRSGSLQVSATKDAAPRCV